jgi:hypothetical protein
MVEYNDILNMVSLLLAFCILFIILFGCKCQTMPFVKEKFENKEEEKKEDDKEELSSFEKSILNGLTGGSITTKDLTSLIKNEQFTEKNLDNLIGHVEKFKGGMKS